MEVEIGLQTLSDHDNSGIVSLEPLLTGDFQGFCQMLAGNHHVHIDHFALGGLIVKTGCD